MDDTLENTFRDDEQPRRHSTDEAEVSPGRVPVEPGRQVRAAPVPPIEDDLESIPATRSLASLPPEDEVSPPRGRSSPVLGCLTGLALLIALLSLALSAYLFYVLSSAQQAATDQIDAAIRALDDFRGAGFHYEYQFNQDIPVVANIPIQQEMSIPFEGNFPINTTIEVPIDAGLLGTFAIDVPIDTNVYVNTEVPINIDETFTINTSIPISMTVPIDVGTEDPEIEGVIGQMQAWLADLRDSLSRGLLPTWLPVVD